MPEMKAHPGCFETCPHLESVQGACGHELRPLLIMHFFENPDAPCPVYEEIRAEEMRSLADRLERR